MNIHPLWYFCLFIRLSIIYLIYKNYNNYKNYIQLFLLFIGLSFIYKGIYGSNNETQINKVFWHDTRFIHGIFYLLSFYYLIKNKLKLSLIILFMDVIFSILYRIILNK